jgi:hypothetical protein
VNAVLREKRYRTAQDQRTSTNVLRVDVMTDIDDAYRGCEPANDSLHDPDVAVAEAEIGEKCDQWVHRGLHRAPHS